MSTPTWEPVGRIVAHETLPYTHVGILFVREGRSRFPVMGGPYRVAGVAASVDLAPQGAPIVLDVNVNGASIYDDQANRPTIAPDATLAVVGVHTQTTVTDGDTLTVDIDQVGASVPGADLVVIVRLQRAP